MAAPPLIFLPSFSLPPPAVFFPPSLPPAAAFFFLSFSLIMSQLSTKNALPNGYFFLYLYLYIRLLASFYALDRAKRKRLLAFKKA